MLRPLGVVCAPPRLPLCNASTESQGKVRSCGWGAKYRIALTILVLLTFSAQSFALCTCDGYCCHCTPIIIDVSGHGFHLTSAANGVIFDISGTGHPVQISWTAQSSDNAFLALPASDGLVHGGTELFGNFTPQPESNDPNGFRALAVYDLPANGGNGDGVIDFHDRIFSSLRLWIDANHDGICQKEELRTLPSMGVNSISLDYSLSSRRDQYGNVFRYRSEVNPEDASGSGVGRVAYDVLLNGVVQPPAANSLPRIFPYLPGQTEPTFEAVHVALEESEWVNSSKFKTASTIPIPSPPVEEDK